MRKNDDYGIRIRITPEEKRKYHREKMREYRGGPIMQRCCKSCGLPLVDKGYEFCSLCAQERIDFSQSIYDSKPEVKKRKAENQKARNLKKKEIKNNEKIISK